MLEGYKDYKETNYDWLPQIPSHWKWVYLSQSCKEQKIKNNENKISQVLSLSYGNIIRKKDINSGLVPKEYSGYQIVNKGNIILRLTDLQNDHTSLRTGLVKEEGIITSAYTCLKPEENSAYLQYLLHSYDTLKVFYGMGGGVRQSIGFKEICNMNVPIPPRSEQDQIVRYLDWKISMIIKYIDAKKKQIELLKEQKRTLINRAITKGIDSYVSLKDSGIDWLGKIPKHWEVRKLRTLLLIKSGNALTNIQISDNDKYPVFGGGKQIGFYKNYNVDARNLIIGRVGANCGYVTNIYYNSWATDNALIVTPKINKEYLFYLLYNADLNKLNHANAQPLITGTQVLSTGVIYTSQINEQKEIVTFLDEKCKTINEIIIQTYNEIDLLQEYQTRLISDVVTGKVNVQGDEVGEFIHKNDCLSDFK